MEPGFYDKPGDFYPHSPCGERRFSSCRPDEPSGISIHTLLAESDARHYTYKRFNALFLSTLSLRRATAERFCNALEHLHFYPHSPCGERHVPVYTLRVTSNFYPRSPCGERRCRRCNGQSISGFLSTLSLRRATWPGLLARPFFLISIHALLAESDLRPTGGPA